ncbi:hypothetical protein Taro_023406 [Colocasia esculenta]|uniref:Uncharacterized protein n=1 Tax=Colocasia esculenta TaxID=4460 RepID=A0A843VAQ7_COLES|nr:hypothetical protein [Colocasia esculenta]
MKRRRNLIGPIWWKWSSKRFVYIRLYDERVDFLLVRDIIFLIFLLDLNRDVFYFHGHYNVHDEEDMVEKIIKFTFEIIHNLIINIFINL